MDPISAKVGGGLGGVGGGDLSKLAGSGMKGGAGKFEAVRMEKTGMGGGQDAMSKLDQRMAEFMKTGKLDSATQAKAPSMAERVAAQQGINLQPNLQFANVGGVGGTQDVWAPQQVQGTGGAQQVASAVQGLNENQAKLDSIIAELRSGKQFSQQELIGMQAEVNMLSEQVQMSTKLVDSAMQSIKSVMQQQV